MRFAAAFAAAMAWSASAGATLVSNRDVPIEQGTQRQVVVEGLEHPWGLAFLPDGRMLVTERPGRLRVIQDGKLLPDPVAGLPQILALGQGGLLDVSLHPRFAETGWVYLTLAQGTAEANWTALARAKLVGSQLEDARILWRVSQTKSGGQHFGSRLAWLPDGTLLMSIGDGGNRPNMLEGRLIREHAQSLSSHIGKVVRLTEDGAPAPGNPFAGKAGADPAIWSLGHRNIQGIAYDPIRKTVWATEHGSLGGDEFNRLSAGGNYGWPVVSRTRDYITAEPVSPAASKPGFADPVLLWETAVAPSGLAVYDGQAFPHWRGDVFSSSLQALDVRRLDLDDAGNVKGETGLRIGQRVRDVRVGPDGLLYVLTDEKTGRLIRFSPSAAAASAPPGR
jgi:glucose/arabinose dehydrogenase